FMSRMLQNFPKHFQWPPAAVGSSMQHACDMTMGGSLLVRSICSSGAATWCRSATALRALTKRWTSNGSTCGAADGDRPPTGGLGRHPRGAVLSGDGRLMFSFRSVRKNSVLSRGTGRDGVPTIENAIRMQRQKCLLNPEKVAIPQESLKAHGTRPHWQWRHYSMARRKPLPARQSNSRKMVT